MFVKTIIALSIAQTIFEGAAWAQEDRSQFRIGIGYSINDDGTIAEPLPVVNPRYEVIPRAMPDECKNAPGITKISDTPVSGKKAIEVALAKFWVKGINSNAPDEIQCGSSSLKLLVVPEIISGDNTRASLEHHVDHKELQRYFIGYYLQMNNRGKRLEVKPRKQTDLFDYFLDGKISHTIRFNGYKFCGAIDGIDKFTSRQLEAQLHYRSYDTKPVDIESGVNLQTSYCSRKDMLAVPFFNTIPLALMNDSRFRKSQKLWSDLEEEYKRLRTIAKFEASGFFIEDSKSADQMIAEIFVDTLLPNEAPNKRTKPLAQLTAETAYHLNEILEKYLSKKIDLSDSKTQEKLESVGISKSTKISFLDMEIFHAYERLSNLIQQRMEESKEKKKHSDSESPGQTKSPTSIRTRESERLSLLDQLSKEDINGWFRANESDDRKQWIVQISEDDNVKIQTSLICYRKENVANPNIRLTFSLFSKKTPDSARWMPLKHGAYPIKTMTNKSASEAIIEQPNLPEEMDWWMLQQSLNFRITNDPKPLKFRGWGIGNILASRLSNLDVLKFTSEYIFQKYRFDWSSPNIMPGYKMAKTICYHE